MRRRPPMVRRVTRTDACLAACAYPRHHPTASRSSWTKASVVAAAWRRAGRADSARDASPVDAHSKVASTAAPRHPGHARRSTQHRGAHVRGGGACGGGDDGGGVSRWWIPARYGRTSAGSCLESGHSWQRGPSSLADPDHAAAPTVTRCSRRRVSMHSSPTTMHEMPERRSTPHVDSACRVLRAAGWRAFSRVACRDPTRRRADSQRSDLVDCRVRSQRSQAVPAAVRASAAARRRVRLAREWWQRRREWANEPVPATHRRHVVN